MRVNKLTKEQIEALTEEGYERFVPAARDHFHLYEGIVMRKGNYWFVFKKVGRKWFLSVYPVDPMSTPTKEGTSPVYMLHCPSLEAFYFISKLIL